MSVTIMSPAQRSSRGGRGAQMGSAMGARRRSGWIAPAIGLLAWTAASAEPARAGLQDSYCHADDLYSLTALTDSAGAPAERYEYADYGQALDPIGLTPVTASGASPLLFAGRRHDAESGFYIFRARMLDPGPGRFTTRDPVGIWGDRVQHGNGYNYAAGSPATRLDPFGREVRDRPLDRWIYFDEWMRSGANAVPDKQPDDLTRDQYTIFLLLAQPYKDFLKNLDTLRRARCVTVRDHYIDGRDEPSQFAQHAGGNGNCTVSLYIGHGIMGDRADRVDEGSLGKVKDALGRARPGADEKKPPPRFAFYSCYAGSYNEAVSRGNRFAPHAGWTGTTTGGGITEHFNENFAEIQKTIQAVCKRCGDAGVTLHFYWGSDKERPAPPQAPPERKE